MPSACNQNCNQGRACTCAPGRAVIKTRPSLLARLRRWWKLRPLIEREAGLVDDRLALQNEMEALTRRQFGRPPSKAIATAIELRRIELLNLDRQVNAVRDHIERLS